MNQRAPGHDWMAIVRQNGTAEFGKAFSLVEGQMHVDDDDLIAIYNDILFNGSKHVDGRAFDKSENRPTNLQIPLVRQQ